MMLDAFPLLLLIDFILVLLTVEFAVMAWRSHKDNEKRPKLACPSIGRFAPTLLSGGFLVLALRAVLSDAETGTILACLTGSLLAHLADLWRMHRK